MMAASRLCWSHSSSFGVVRICVRTILANRSAVMCLGSARAIWPFWRSIRSKIVALLLLPFSGRRASLFFTSAVLTANSLDLPDAKPSVRAGGRVLFVDVRPLGPKPLRVEPALRDRLPGHDIDAGDPADGPVAEHGLQPVLGL